MSRKFLSIALVACIVCANGETFAQDEDALMSGDYRGVSKHSILASAKDGNQFAQYTIGDIYRLGIGGSPNYEKAVFWFRKSAQANYAEAQHALSGLYLLGLGVTRDFVESVRLERMAAWQGNVRAQYGLGTLYQRGYGVEKDGVRAYMWYDIAAQSTDRREMDAVKDATSLRESIARKLSAEQLSEAQILVSECLQQSLRDCR